MGSYSRTCIFSRGVSYYRTSADIVKDRPILVREFIHSALYDPQFGYFATRPGVVGVIENSIQFNTLEGRNAYMQYLDSLYKKSDTAWFTPVEIFKPWYGYSIAEAILRTANLSVPLKIYEIGGGSGTCAKCILDYMMLHAPAKVYNNMTYTSVEISPALASKQVERIAEVSSHLKRFNVECRNATDKSGWGNVNEQPCWVIMLEVLDNLPHDVVYCENQSSSWMEVLVERKKHESSISEIYRPLQDPLIKKCINIIENKETDVGWGARAFSAARSIMSKVVPKSRRAWVPTGCLQLLEVLHRVVPKMSLIASDFSYLPDVRIPGVRAPLVSSKKGGCTEDYSSYLEAKGDADIFFPTDFFILELIDHYCAEAGSQLKGEKNLKPIKKRRSTILDMAGFMEEFGLPSKTSTKDGYNPLLEDFQNTKIYLSVPTHNFISQKKQHL
ncbi:uncharacterized protein LOC131071320 isoform X2 [Cryptomeria japonica]|uniref:uncharacterized protein LOC131071320 isoform X2 n=1 Tax=Cryptomeria japonica TaxID=3369 RepID=UPI0027DA4EA0|nr:uncharacterized protein LOC131071320 isoform X2 [Cryptomeria japonica]